MKQKIDNSYRIPYYVALLGLIGVAGLGIFESHQARKYRLQAESYRLEAQAWQSLSRSLINRIAESYSYSYPK